VSLLGLKNSVVRHRKPAFISKGVGLIKHKPGARTVKIFGLGFSLRPIHFSDQNRDDRNIPRSRGWLPHPTRSRATKDQPTILSLIRGVKREQQPGKGAKD
jgi:hypothetical protein